MPKPNTNTIKDLVKFSKSTDHVQLAPLIKDWRRSLTAPQDGMWETFMDQSIHWIMKAPNSPILGYACVNDSNQLLQFYVLDQYSLHGVEFFEKFIGQQGIQEAIIGTNNPIPLSLSMHFQKRVEIDTYLFESNQSTRSSINGNSLRIGRVEDLDHLVAYFHKAMGAPVTWLSGYVTKLIHNGEIFVLEDDQQILGTCEVRRSASNREIADIGMVVAPSHRGKGLGTWLLGQARDIAVQWNRNPICSCEKGNTASLKCITANGFRCSHQMLKFRF